MSNPWIIRRTVDLAAGEIPVERLCALATTSSRAAHQLRIALKEGGKPVGLTGISVMLNLILTGERSMTVNGRIEDGELVATLPAQCYPQEGDVRGTLMAMQGADIAVPVYAFVLYVRADLTDVLIDPTNTVPSLNAILAQLDAARAATNSANAAAANANTAASSANAAASGANAAKDAANRAEGAANTAASAANAARDAANAAAGKIDRMEASATGLAAGSAPTAQVTDDGVKKILALGIPKGDKGDTGATPQIAVEVATGAAGSEAQVSVTGTAEEPVIHLTIPRGDVGDIANLTVNGRAPDGSGAVTLTPEDVSAYPEGSIRTVSLSLAVSAWTGSGPFAATIPRGDVTESTWADIRLTEASMGHYAARIDWETSAGQITLTTTVKPTGVIEGTMVLMEVV